MLYNQNKSSKIPFFFKSLSMFYPLQSQSQNGSLKKNFPFPNLPNPPHHYRHQPHHHLLHHQHQSSITISTIQSLQPVFVTPPVESKEPWVPLKPAPHVPPPARRNAFPSSHPLQRSLPSLLPSSPN